MRSHFRRQSPQHYCKGTDYTADGGEPRSPNRVAILASITLSLALSISLPAVGQETSFPLPVTSGLLGNKDAAALLEVAQHILAVEGSSWQDLEGTGTLSYPDGETHSASLFLSGSGYSRLDVAMGSGTRSVRLQSSLGTYEDEHGQRGTLLPGTSRAGLLAFPRLWTDAASPSLISLSDHGQFAATPQTLHRVTLEYQLSPGTFKRGDPTVATDLYFDPTTHLLLFSVDNLAFANSPGQRFLRVTSYEAYQQFGGRLVPTLIKERLNGQLEWSLRLNQVTINAGLPATTFAF